MAKLRINYSEARLARSLVERGLILGDVLEGVFEDCANKEGLLTEALVKGGYLSDEEVSKVASEVFSLPFLSVEVHTPTDGALKGISPEFLKRWCLVPLVRNEELLTVAIPASLSPRAYDVLSRMADGSLALVVGTVLTNRAWLDNRFK